VGANFVDAARKLAGQTALLLGWRPDDFWNSTPAELASIIAAASGDSGAVDALTLSELMALFPDASIGGNDG
jgi:uncharacterized phage protein (TIGR02216 family)